MQRSSALKNTQWGAWVLAVGALGVAVAGVATASTSTSASKAASTGKYTVCSSSKHVVSVESHGKCAKHTHKVKIAAKGPKGHRGSTGAAGPTSAYIYDYSELGGNAPQGGGTAPSLAAVQSPTLISLPAGSYLIHYDMNLNDVPNTDNGYVSCTGVYNTAGTTKPLYGTSFYAGLAGHDDDLASGSNTEPLVVTAPTTVAVLCAAATVDVTFESFDVVATPVTSLHATGFAPHIRKG
jgi:hypothetical protein